MLKLLGTSSGKNNKSCGIFHHESNKISFAFFGFFYDFLRNLQKSAKWLYYLRITFAPGSLRSFRFLQLYPCFAAEPLERLEGLRLGPWGVGRWQSGETPARVRRSPAGGGGRGVA
jgi:hypothetical protein